MNRTEWKLLVIGLTIAIFTAVSHFVDPSWQLLYPSALLVGFCVARGQQILVSHKKRTPDAYREYLPHNPKEN